MTHSELLRICADAIDNAEQFGIEPGVQLVWPKGLGRFPMRGELCCVNNAEERVYRVTVADAAAFISRTLKATRFSPPAPGQKPGVTKMTEHHQHHHHAHAHDDAGKLDAGKPADTDQNAGSSSSGTSTNAPADQVGQQNAPVSGEQSAKGASSAAEPRDPPASQPVGDVNESSDGNGT